MDLHIYTFFYFLSTIYNFLAKNIIYNLHVLTLSDLQSENNGQICNLQFDPTLVQFHQLQIMVCSWMHTKTLNKKILQRTYFARTKKWVFSIVLVANCNLLQTQSAQILYPNKQTTRLLRLGMLAEHRQ